MGKPTGLGLFDPVTGLGLHVKTPSRVEGMIWDAVQEARISGWSAQRLRREVAEAWEEDAKSDLAADREELLR